MPGAEIIELRPRARRTLPMRLLKKALREERLDDAALVQLERARPRTRSECRGGLRPCPFVSCRYHLFLDVNPDNGSVRFNFPDKSVAELEASCALDVAEDGGLTLERIGHLLGMTRERIRQLERDGLAVLGAELER
jgi:hypothetical protein